MKGNNTLLLNEATIIAAVQEYLDRRTVGCLVTVTAVNLDSSDRCVNTFKVSVQEIKPE